ncbi:MAG: hypothetical protein K0R54_2477 [Clostridiaceae bacterium]|jgi:hypothetical protein|nr:hypothetical protein [Clostridiaceae bacterium]
MLNHKKLIISGILSIVSLITISGCSIKNTKDSTTVFKNNTVPVKYISKFTGEEISKEISNKAPFMAIIENSKDARPQSGLINADIVFETMAEGGIPRFIAIYQKEASNKIGPIRSARPYFIDLTKEYNLPFAHCGGSEEAIMSIKSENLMSLDEMSHGNFYWRDKARKAPHNLYTSSEYITNLLSQENFNNKPASNLQFDNNYWNNSNLLSANKVNLKLNKYYSTLYTLNNYKYNKSMDSAPLLDKDSSQAVSTNNIIIQVTKIKLQPDGQHLQIDLVGEGDVYVISNGKYVKGKWYRKDTSSPTILEDTSGNAIPLHTGKSWWHIVDKNCIVDIN